MSKSITPEQLASSGTEDGEQKALICWCALNAEKYPELLRLFHIPNGGFRNKIEAAKFKAMGVRSGVLDLMLPVPRGIWHGLFVELKRKDGGTVSKEQNDWIAFLKAQGYGAIVCHGWIKATEALIKYLEWK